nr:hypothetical protein [Acetobacter persici]
MSASLPLSPIAALVLAGVPAPALADVISPCSPFPRPKRCWITC